jgi:hypothetical protein
LSIAVTEGVEKQIFGFELAERDQKA